MKKHIIFWLIPVLLNLHTRAQSHLDTNIYKGAVFDENIRTVIMYRKGWPLTYPYLRLHEDEQLVLSFDDLSEDIRDLSYRLIHCNAGWKSSGLYTQDFMDGFSDNPVTDYRYSTNTTVPFVHYSITIPNNDITIKLSGNYIIMVYKEGEPDHPLLTQRFVVFENLVSIKPGIMQGQDNTFPGTGQQVVFEVTASSFAVTDPYRDITAVIIQNGNQDITRYLKKPDSSTGGRFSFSLSSSIVFPGSNEFRHFEMTDIRFVSKDVADIRYSPPYYNVLLKKGSFRRFSPYFLEEDLNGRFYIKNARGSDPDVDADYVNVFFTLAAPFPVEGSDVFIYGALSGWHPDNRFKMQYNMQLHQYEKSVLLKQGHYDYLYVTTSAEGIPDLTRLEGNHFETENDYTIILYYNPPGADYDRIIGLRTFNSRRE